MKYTVSEALKYHFLKYRKMTPQDTVKLLYQSEYGGGHLITDENYVLLRLKNELSETKKDENIPTLEPLGDDAFRVNLANLPSGLTPETLTKIFALSAPMFSGDNKRFSSKLSEVNTYILEKYTSFSQYDYVKYLEEYYKNGGGAVRHSFIYNIEYKPAYRVIHRVFAPFLSVFAKIDSLLSEKSGFAIKIDGRCGSGKSTLAGLIADVYGCGVVHADDFYLPINSPVRNEGDNLEFDRMNSEITSILRGEKNSYGAFDCSVQKIACDVSASASPFLLIEGSYSLHPKLSVPSELSVFLTVGKEEQLRRIEKRNPASVDAFREKWIPMEEKYYAEHNVSEHCDFIIETD